MDCRHLHTYASKKWWYIALTRDTLALHNTTEYTSEILCGNDALDTDSTKPPSDETIINTFNEPHSTTNSVDAYDNWSNASLDLSPSPQNEK